MLIYCKHITPRVQYIFDFVFKEHFGLHYSITIDKDFFVQWQEEKIAYAEEEIMDCLQIIATELLFENDIHEQTIESVLTNEIQCPFATHKGMFPFDVFAAMFYLLSRYEEYLPHQQNKYGQYIATQSIAYKNNFLQKPVVNIWLQWLQKELQNKYPNLVFKQQVFAPTITYDIDTAYAYKGRSTWLTIGGICRDLIKLQFEKISKRLKVLNGKAKDDYDTYDSILELANKYQYKPILFFLVGDRNRYNKNIDPQTSTFNQLMEKLKNKVYFGIHPSYYTPDDLALLETEKLLLENKLGDKIVLSRQHYLRLQLPNTYKNCSYKGITDEYSMGFAEMPGFRAGTCSPFYFFDITINKATSLKIHPITFMEGSFAEDMQMQPLEALEWMKNLLHEVKNVQGEFICIWHNHTISDSGFWKGWKRIHDKIIQEAFSNE